MIGFVKQLLRVVLAVDADKQCAQLFEHRHRDWLSIYAADIFSIGENVTLHQKLVGVIVNLVLCKPVRPGRRRKDGADAGAAAAGADDVAVGPLAKNGGNGVNDDGFARAGFTGEDVEACVKTDVSLFNDGNIFNVEHAQHKQTSKRN